MKFCTEHEAISAERETSPHIDCLLVAPVSVQDRMLAGGYLTLFPSNDNRYFAGLEGKVGFLVLPRDANIKAAATRWLYHGCSVTRRNAP